MRGVCSCQSQNSWGNHQCLGKQIVWAIIAGILISSNLAGIFSLCTISRAAPVIIVEDDYGSWGDNFTDTAGIAMWDNLQLAGNGVALDDYQIFYENFTGLNGSSPDTSKWDIVEDGYTLEIDSNTLKASISASPANFKWEMVRNKYNFSFNHNITWTQQIHTTSGSGMFVHFVALNGSDNVWLFAVNQNHMNQYMIYNYISDDSIQIGSSVSGWHDYEVTFNEGTLTFYFDGVKKYEYNFGLESVKYRFGTGALGEPSTIYTDDILVYANHTTGNLTSTKIVLPTGQDWDSVIVNKTEFGSENIINVSILDGTTYLPIPGYENLTGTDIDISAIDNAIYPTLRLRTHFLNNGSTSPILHGWNVTWSDTAPPITPTGFKVNNPFNGYSLVLSWNPNQEPDNEYYLLYYSLDNITFYRLTSLDNNTLHYTHYGLTQGTTYYYKIAAGDEVPNQSPFSRVVAGVPDMDYDGDGIGNLADSDDDNDGIPDISDSYPLNPLNDIETTIDDIRSMLYSMNLTGLQEVLEYLNQSLPTLGSLSDQLSGVNDSLIDRVTDAETNILSDIATISASLSNEIQNMLVSITNDIIDLNYSLSDELMNLLSTITDEFDGLQPWLELVLNLIDTNLTKTNNTLHSQLDFLDQSITNFYNNLEDGIGVVLSDLQSHDQTTGQDHSDIIGLLLDLLDGQIEHEQIDDLRTSLINLANDLSGHNQTIADDIMGIVNDIETFENNVDQQLDKINDTLDQLASLEQILKDLEALDQSLAHAEEDIRDSIDERSTRDEDKERFFMIEMFLIILSVLLVINLIATISMVKRRKEEGPSAASNSPIEKSSRQETSFTQPSIAKEPTSPAPSTSQERPPPLRPPQGAI